MEKLTQKSVKFDTMPEVRRLNYTRREAAIALGVSLPILDAFMNRRDNPLPSIRNGRKLILIPVDSLEQWNMEEAARTIGAAARR